jgi:hypothetical protein
MTEVFGLLESIVIYLGTIEGVSSRYRGEVLTLLCTDLLSL